MSRLNRHSDSLFPINTVSAENSLPFRQVMARSVAIFFVAALIFSVVT